MKIKEKLKKIITGVGIFFTTITTKVFAKETNVDINEVLRKIENSNNGMASLYGIEPPDYQHSISYYILKTGKFFIIPIILIIGFIILVQKKNNVKIKNLKKAITIIAGSFTTIFIIALIINFIEYLIYVQ